MFSQIDGGPVPPVCVVPCNFGLNSGGIDLGFGATAGTFEIRPNPTACDWTAVSDASWLTIPGGSRTGNTFAVVPYSVTMNNFTRRTGRITVTWATGSAQFVVVQAGTPFVASFTMFDPFRSGAAATTECWFRSSSAPCNFTSTANLTGGNYVHTWTASYFYGGEESITQTGASSTFSLSDVCGDTGSSCDGPASDLIVTLTITDDRGNTITLRSGEGSQPALIIRRFSC